MTASQDFEIVVVEMGVSQCMFPVVQDWTHVDHFMSQLIPRFAARSRTFPFCSGPTTACTSRVHQRSVRTHHPRSSLPRCAKASTSVREIDGCAALCPCGGRVVVDLVPVGKHQRANAVRND